MDWIKYPYSTWMKFYKDSDVLTPVCWYYCEPGAKDLGFYTRFASGVYGKDHQADWEGVGEAPFQQLTFGKRSPCCVLPGTGPVGTPKQFAEGVSINDNLPMPECLYPCLCDYCPVMSWQINMSGWDPVYGDFSTFNGTFILTAIPGACYVWTWEGEGNLAIILTFDPAIQEFFATLSANGVPVECLDNVDVYYRAYPVDCNGECVTLLLQSSLCGTTTGLPVTITFCPIGVMPPPIQVGSGYFGSSYFQAMPFYPGPGPASESSYFGSSYFKAMPFYPHPNAGTRRQYFGSAYFRAMPFYPLV